MERLSVIAKAVKKGKKERSMNLIRSICPKQFVHTGVICLTTQLQTRQIICIF